MCDVVDLPGLETISMVFMPCIKSGQFTIKSISVVCFLNVFKGTFFVGVKTKHPTIKPVCNFTEDSHKGVWSLPPQTKNPTR